MIKLLAQSWACNKHSINSCRSDHHHYHTLQENNDLDALLFSAYKRPYRGCVFRCSDLNLRKAQAVKWEEGRGCHCTPSSTSKERETRQSVRGRPRGGGRPGTWTSKPGVLSQQHQGVQDAGSQAKLVGPGLQGSEASKRPPFFMFLTQKAPSLTSDASAKWTEAWS